MYRVMHDNSCFFCCLCLKKSLYHIHDSPCFTHEVLFISDGISNLICAVPISTASQNSRLLLEIILAASDGVLLIWVFCQPLI
jgi:hypothetical protein